MNLLIGLIFILAGAAAIFVGVKYGKRQPVKSAVPIYFPFCLAVCILRLFALL